MLSFIANINWSSGFNRCLWPLLGHDLDNLPSLSYVGQAGQDAAFQFSD